jgi:hypothetical protein
MNMKNFKNIFLVASLVATTIVSAQVKIGDNATTIDASTALEIESTNKGFLMPRMANPALITSPATGLQVYNTTTNTVWFYNGTAWTEMGAGASGTSIYSADGQLAGVRVVDQNNNNLTFQTGTARTIVDGNFQFTKALYANIRTHSLASNIAWTADDFAVVITNLGISGQLLLPDPTSNAGRILSIRNNAGGTVTFAAGSGAPINQSSIAGGSGYMYMSDGTNWHPIGSR